MRPQAKKYLDQEVRVSEAISILMRIGMDEPREVPCAGLCQSLSDLMDHLGRKERYESQFKAKQITLWRKRLTKATCSRVIPVLRSKAFEELRNVSIVEAWTDPEWARISSARRKERLVRERQGGDAEGG